jgi:putative sterol carrier protein
MVTKEDLKEALQGWIDKLQDPDVASEFEGYVKTMQFVFPDIDVKLQLVFNGPQAKLVEGLNTDAEMSLEVSSELFMGIATGELDPMEAFMEGTLKPKGNMQDLERLEIFMD